MICDSCSSKPGYSSLVPTEVELGFGILYSKIGTFSPNSVWLGTLLGFWGGLGACSPGKKLLIWGLQTAGNASKLSILPSLRYIWVILKSFTVPSSGPGCTMCTPLPTGLDFNAVDVYIYSTLTRCDTTYMCGGFARGDIRLIFALFR